MTTELQVRLRGLRAGIELTDRHVSFEMSSSSTTQSRRGLADCACLVLAVGDHPPAIQEFVFTAIRLEERVCNKFQQFLCSLVWASGGLPARVKTRRSAQGVLLENDP